MANLRLDAAYNAQIQAIRSRVTQFASARFAAGQYRDADVIRFVNQMVPTILASRRQVSALTDAYLAQKLSGALGIRVPPRGPIDTSGLRGVPASDVYARPFQTVWTKLSNGLPFDAAVNAGAARLVDVIATDLQMAKTYTAQDVFSNSPDRIIGYSRVVSGANTCALCYVAATQMYHRGDLMPIHPGCGCSVEPVTKSQPFDHVAADQQLMDVHQAVKDQLGSYSSDARAIDYRKLVVVQDHGEYGPTLAIAGQHFDALKAAA